MVRSPLWDELCVFVVQAASDWLDPRNCAFYTHLKRKRRNEKPTHGTTDVVLHTARFETL